MRQVRSFLAISLTEEVRRNALAIRDRLAESLPRVRWTTAETLHLTLKFFGDVPEESLETIGEVVLSVARLQPPFQVEIAEVGAFPSPARPRVFWLGVKGDVLPAFHAALEEALGAIGIPRENRPFSPHLTLGRSRDRVSDSRALLDTYRETSCGILPVDKVVLFESRLHPAGAVHLPRKTVFLGR